MQDTGGYSMIKSRSRTKRIAAVCAAAVVVGGGGGAAFAYWTSSGSGTGTATTGTSTTFTITSAAPTGDPLVPGGASQSVAFTVANPSAATLALSSVVVTVAKSDGTVWDTEPGCSAADYTIGTPAIVYGPVDGLGDVDGTVTVTLVDTGSDQDACQGVTVPLYFVAS